MASDGKLEHRPGQINDGKPDKQNVTTVSDPAINAGLKGLLLHDGEELSHDQVERLRGILEMELEGCEVELGRKDRVKYPENLSWTNYLEYLFFPM